LNIEKIVAETEKARLDRAIVALEESDVRSAVVKRRNFAKPLTSVRNQPANQAGRQLTPEGRNRLSESMKKRWAERRRKKA
jgi:Spy/CpxP family protein refolding chaperone